MPDLVFVDTWGWLALGHCKDTRHQEVKSLYEEFRRIESKILTTDFVLDELITLLFQREVFEEAIRFMEGIFRAAELDQLTIVRITSDRFVSAWRLRKAFQDKPRISFTDLSSIAVMQEHKIKKVLTEDEHFIQIGMGFQKFP